jgi:hypothetical protein
MEKDQLKDCPCGGSNACYEQKVDKDLTTWLCFGCGKSSSSVMQQGSAPVLKAIELAPELYKDISYTDKDGQVWFPSTITLPGKGMVFVDGTSKDNWRWAAVRAVEISEEEKNNFPKEQTHKMDMKNIKHFSERDFIEALSEIDFFDVAVGSEE